MGLLEDIKTQAKKSGGAKKHLLFLKSGVKVRVRFLQEVSEGLKYVLHNSYELGINSLCRELLGEDCNNCSDEDLKERVNYGWWVWDYEAKEERFLGGAANQYSPIPQIAGFYEAYGTITDRDYEITQNGANTSKSFTVIPLKESKFKNKKAQAWSEKKTLKMLAAAYPEDTDEEDEKENKSSRRGKKNGKNNKNEKTSRRSKDEYQEEEYNYDEMSAKALYSLCKERDIEVKAKKDEEYYIEKLEEWDLDNEDDSNDSEDKPNYKKMTARELYDLCEDRDISVKPKKDKDYYIEKLEDWDEENSDLEDEEDW